MFSQTSCKSCLDFLFSLTNSLTLIDNSYTTVQSVLTDLDYFVNHQQFQNVDDPLDRKVGDVPHNCVQLCNCVCNYPKIGVTTPNSTFSNTIPYKAIEFG